MKTKKRFAIKCIAMFMLVVFTGQIIHPTAALALTSGPSQPEVTQFQQVSASDMVDLFSGDFSYNIPLFEVPGPNGGYPFNLSYQSAPSMDQEASWVGLGWNINPGSIVRNMRGLPDDFDGQKIRRELDMKPNITAGIGVNVNYEFFSADYSKLGEATITESGVSLNMGVKLYYNNYKGVGYTLQPGLSFGIPSKGSKTSAGIGFNFSFDSQDGGIGANLDITVSTAHKGGKLIGGGKNSFSAGIGYNSNSGVNASTGFSRSFRGRIDGKKVQTSGGGSSSISFAHPSVTPSIGTEMSGGNFTGGVTIGFDPTNTGTNHLYVGFSAFVDVMEIANKDEKFPAYGYLNYHNKGTRDNALVDFNRDKDVIVKENSTPNLHNPVLTYDYYMVNGQGTGGMFRPYRQEVGYIHEQSRMSGSGGGSLGFNIPGDGRKIGINVGFNFSDSRTGRWDAEQNEASTNGTVGASDEFGYFKGKQFDETAANGMEYEGPYFKMNGSMSTLNMENFNDLGGYEAVRFNIDGNHAERELVNPYASSLDASYATDFMQERRPRGQEITPINNGLLLQDDFESMVEMQSFYYDHDEFTANDWYDMEPDMGSKVLRIEYDGLKNLRESHIGGFVVTNPDGNRYVYALPAYNTLTKEHIYTSVPDEYGQCITHKEYPEGTTSIPYKFTGTGTEQYDITDQFKSVTTTPSYTHSHLLTSILGTDYVDSDETPGPSDDDYGYWVKFTYVKTTGAEPGQQYKWRTPFTGASYNAGSEASYEDDKVNFTYGEKDIWYLATVETKTHVAVFEMSPRMDGIGAAEEINNFDIGGDDHMDATAYGKLYKLDKIKLYAKEEYKRSLAEETPELAIPIQTIHFEYDYSLCRGIPNNNLQEDKNENVLGVATGSNINDPISNPDYDAGKPKGPDNQDEISGKLTLKAVYFTYKNDHTGKDHKYKFSYDSNPQYKYASNRYDRWGTYNWYTDNGQCANADFPYTNQFPQHPFSAGYSAPVDNDNYTDWISNFNEDANEAAAAWCLSKIELPSGGSINIEYESDDYAYVQQREATQMFRVTSFGYGNDPTVPNGAENDLLYDTTVDVDDADLSDACNSRRKVYFRLEEPIRADESVINIYRKIYNDYIHPLRRGNEYQVYMSARVNLRGGVWEDIESYYNLDIDPATINNLMNITTSFPNDGYNSGSETYPDNNCYQDLPFGVCKKTTDLVVSPETSAVACYTHGYVMLENSPIDNYDDNMENQFHPVSLNAWYYMKENLSQVLYTVADLDPGDDDYERIIRGGSLLSIFPQMAAMFRGLPVFCYNDDMAYRADLNRTWIKLATPDLKKKGGGCRVKKLYMEDDSQWAQDSKNDKIGQVYDYTITESKYNDITSQTVNKTISSGVASYEPIIGGDENALHYAKFYNKNLPFKSSTQTYYEGPHNEAYFPAPQVGYRKVTVSSLSTDQLKNMTDETEDETEGIRATGVTVNEFYTAKEFPTIVYETDLYIDPYVEAIVPIPFIGTITDKQVVASQGYVIRLNDMHGRPKSVASYGINAEGTISTIPTSSVKYFYKSKEIVYDNRSAFELENEVEVLRDDPNMRGEFISTESHGVPGSNGYEALTESATLGLDYDFFYDMRQSYTKAGQGGLDFNLDLMGFGIFVCPVPIPWPSYSQSYAKINTVVANKIIHRAAILDKVIATDGQSTVQTQNLVFDPYTGDALLTVVNNNFNEPVYNYSIPGRFMYAGMDGAWKNSLLEFSAKDNITETGNVITITSTTELRNSVYPSILGPHSIEIADLLPLLHEGDEFIIEGPSDAIPEVRAYLLTPVSAGNGADCHTLVPFITELKFYIVGTFDYDPSNEYKFTLVRSGRRNLLSNNIGSVISLNTTNESFLVNPNDPNPHTILEIIGRSPLKNREIEDLSSSSSTISYISYLAAFLNDRLSGGVLQMGTFHLNDPSFYSGGSNIYPELYSILDYISIGSSSADENGVCLDCPDLTYETTMPSGYSITIKVKDIYGGDCIYIPCFARKYLIVDRDPYVQGVPAHIYSFSTSSDTKLCYISANYGGSSQYETLACSLYDICTKDHSEFTAILNSQDPLISSENYETNTTSESCFECQSIDVTPYIFKIKNIVQASAYIPSDTWGNMNDDDRFSTGKAGIWRPSINYYYKDERYQDVNTADIQLSLDGVFAGKTTAPFTDKDRFFYLYNWWVSAGNPLPYQWILNNQITRYNINGVAIETKDILNIYNGTIFDQYENLPVAIADNAQRKEMLAVNFDNNSLSDFGAPAPATDVSFTGKYALKCTSNVDVVIPFSSDFTLEVGSKYLLSAWSGGYNMTKSPKLLDEENPDQMNILVIFLNSSNVQVGTTVTVTPKGFIYEGFNNSYWRKMEGSFTVPLGAAKLKLTFVDRDPTGAGNDHYTKLFNPQDYYAYFDDLRIHPLKSIMKTFVYDQVDFKLKAELDENNFPMYYGYDASGQLTTVKVLTEGGIKTIKEAYSNTKVVH